MQVPITSFEQWHKRYWSEEAYAMQRAELRWPNGFQCPHCGHTHGWLHRPRRLYECARCHRRISVTTGTLLHSSPVPLTQWFSVLYWMGLDKGGFSALRLSKLIGFR